MLIAPVVPKHPLSIGQNSIRLVTSIGVEAGPGCANDRIRGTALPIREPIFRPRKSYLCMIDVPIPDVEDIEPVIMLEDLRASNTLLLPRMAGIGTKYGV